MSWYLVKIIFRIICGDGKHTAQFEEQLRLISAASSKEAIAKADALAKKEEVSFLNYAQQPVHWQLIAVTDVYSFETGVDGAVVFSKICEEDHPALFIHSAKIRSQDVLNHCVEIIHQ